MFFAPDVWAGFLVLPDPAFAKDSPRRKSKRPNQQAMPSASADHPSSLPVR